MTVFFFVLAYGVFPYAVAVAMPTWRWLVGITLTIGGAIAVLWIQDWIVTSEPGYRESIDGALGRAFFGLATLGFASGVVVRAVTMALASTGLPSRHTVTICMLGCTIVPGYFASAAAWQSWKQRPPSQACLNATFHVKVANAAFAIPAAGFFNVYLGNRSGADAYYFALNPGMRAFCALSGDGRQPIRATLISLRPAQNRYDDPAPSICTSPVADWATTYCAAYGTASGRQDESVPFPLDIHIFAPDEFILGEFGGSRSTYADSLVPKTWPGAPVYIRSDISDPDQQPLTFECNENGSGYWCKTSYPWKGGANLNYTFRATRSEVAEKGKRIDAETRKFLAGFQARP